MKDCACWRNHIVGLDTPEFTLVEIMQDLVIGNGR
nr:MAG TPA: hypothetical protein [Caudoviricetes sp.]